ncbi:methyltransferase domain-containing protein [bacterium]|nr:methyltransferase domain-containing protein [bacterium]
MNPCLLCGQTNKERLWEWEVDPFLNSLNIPNHSTAFSACQSCGFVFQDPFLADGIVQRLYTELNLEARFTDFHERLTWFQRAAGSDAQPGLMLDVGCSEGKQSLAFMQAGWNAIGVEPSTDAANKAKAQGVEVIYGAVDQADMGENRFDLILFFHLLEHLKNPRVFLQQAMAALRKNGFLYFEIPNLQVPWGTLYSFFPSFHYSIFGPDHIERWVRELGLEIIRAEISVNQRWLLRKRPNTYPLNPTQPKTNIRQIKQKILMQKIAVQLVKYVEFFCQEQTQPKPDPFLVDSATQQYVKHNLKWLSNGNSQWQAIAEQNPFHGLSRLYRMLSDRMDILHLLDRFGCHVLSEARFIRGVKALQYQQFYREEYIHLQKQATPPNMREAARILEALLTFFKTIQAMNR